MTPNAAEKSRAAKKASADPFLAEADPFLLELVSQRAHLENDNQEDGWRRSTTRSWRCLPFVTATVAALAGVPEHESALASGLSS